LIAFGPKTNGNRSKRTIAENRRHPVIHVQLLWRPRDNRVSVAVSDTKTREAFELEVRHGQRALDVFRHPYAYAATDVAIAEGGLASSVGSRR